MKILFAYDLGPRDNEFVHCHFLLLKKMGHEVISSTEKFWNYDGSFDYVVINWPEYFFKWRNQITDQEIAHFNSTIDRIRKKRTKIITFFHDEYSHFGREANLNLLFDITYGKSDFLVHLGEYSLNKYKDIYCNAKHFVIHHPKYSGFNFSLNSHDCRKELGFTPEEFIVVVPGAIRKRLEVNYCLGIFEKINKPNKKIIFVRTEFFNKPRNEGGIQGFKSQLYYYLFTKKYFKSTIKWFSGFMSNDQLSKYFSMCNLVIIPRTDILNSGNITLAAQFGKPMIGTGSGNMGEFLKFLNQKISSTANDISINIEPDNSDGETLKMKIEEYAGEKIIIEQWTHLLATV